MKTKTISVLTALLLLLGGVTAQQGSSPDLNAVMINSDPVPLQSGEDAEITFKVWNDGSGTAEDVEVSVVDNFPFQLKPDRKRTYSIGDLGPGENVQLPTAQILVDEEASDGPNEFEIRLDTRYSSQTESFPVQVQSQDIKLNLANLKTSPAKLKPDMENARLTIETVNNGEKTAENVVINTDLPEGFEETSSFSTRQALGNMAAGQVKTAEFSFDVEDSAEKGNADIPANITYSTSDSDTRITENADFSFHLAGRPQFEVTDVESELRTGGTGEVKLTVTNTGQEKASSTRVRVLDSSDQPFSYDSASKYVGTLDPGQNGSAVFDVTVESGASVKDYLIDFEIRGVKDTETYVESTTAQVPVAGGEESSGPPVVPIAVVLVIAAGGFILRKRIISLIAR